MDKLRKSYPERVRAQIASLRFLFDYKDVKDNETTKS